MSQSPIFEGLVAPPAPLPMGVRFADRVTIDEIDAETANQIHEAHHSYIPRGRRNASVRHGVYFDGRLVGTVSYAYLMCSSDIAGTPPDRTMEVARCCIALDMPNLASCAMAKSQKEFARTFAAENDIDLLVTYVREDYEGSMYSALSGLGWRVDGISPGRKPPNRRDRDIYYYDKVRWVCEL